MSRIKSIEAFNAPVLAHILTDAGQIFITALSGAHDYDLKTLQVLNTPADILVVFAGSSFLTKYRIDLEVSADVPSAKAVRRVYELLWKEEIVAEYNI